MRHLYQYHFSPASLGPFALILLLSACDPSAPHKDTQPASPLLPHEASIKDASAKKAPPKEASTPKLDSSKDAQVKKEGHPPPAIHAPRSSVPPKDVPRVYAKSRHVWVRSMPTSDVQWIGFLWWGGSVEIRGEERVPGAGCKKQWVPIEPRGWVCVDDERATTDSNDPELRSIYPYRPDVESPWPHKYAAVHAPLRRYKELPDEATQKARERGYTSHMAAVHKARSSQSTAHLPEILRSLDPSLSGRKAPSLLPSPRGLSEGHDRIIGRSAMTFVGEFDWQERSFLLTGDLNWVPKDRVEVLRPAQFKGVELGKDFHLPLAFFRGKARPAFVKTEEGNFAESEETFARHAHVQLTDDVEVIGRTRYYRVAGQDLWVSSKHAVIPTPRDKTPWGAPLGKPDTTGKARKGRATWLEASILGGWLVAFEGTTPVYATMISAGRGGTPHPNKTALETASTPTGWFPIGGKFKTATMMSSSTPIVHTDVPWTQNFSGPHAIHSAYWHEDWGNLKSAGCVNLAPRDGKWLFEFTEPDVPQGWHGVRYISRYGGGSTLFVVHQ